MNEAVLLDTSIASYLHKGDKAANIVAPYMPHMENKSLAISFQTAEELRFGAIKANWGEDRRSKLEQFIQRFIIIQTSADLIETSARLRAAAASNGSALETADGWIAATAALLGVPLLTHDKDFSATITFPGLKIICLANANGSP